MEELLHEFEIRAIQWLPEIKIGSIDLSVSKAVLMMWLAVIVVFLMMFLAARRSKLVPTGWHNFIEALIEFLRRDIVLEMMGKEGLPWLPFIITLFFFILTSNLLGLIPGGFTATSNINMTGTLAIIVLFSYIGVGIRKHGVYQYFRGFVPRGVPLVIGIPFIFPIEFISNVVARPFSLAVRLFANMFAGHLVIGSFLGLAILFKSYIVAPFPLAGGIAMSGLEILFSIIQAYIFTILAALYLGDAIHGGH